MNITQTHIEAEAERRHPQHLVPRDKQRFIDGAKFVLESQIEQQEPKGEYIADELELRAARKSWAVHGRVVQDELSYLDGFIQCLRAAPPSSWISVTERTPEDEDDVEVWCQPPSGKENYHSGIAIDYYLPDEKIWAVMIYVTHWRPLPQGPGKKE